MNISPSSIVSLVVGAALYFLILWAIDRALTGTARIGFRYAGVAVTIGAVFYGLSYASDHGALPYDRAVDVTKALIAIAAAGCVFYEQHRAGIRRPVAERWKKIVGITLGLAAIVCYFNGFRFGYPKYYHRWDQYHYYMGAKYFREMGYDGLYKCSVIAQDELGNVEYEENGRKMRLDMSKEVRHADKKIRNLGGDNLLMPVTDILAHPEQCKASFSPERWEEYKADVKFFRTSSDKTYWEDMQKDHGFNPPPVWTVAGYLFSAAAPAGKMFSLPLIGAFNYLQGLAMLDIVYLTGMFVGLWWAFGWRVFAVGAIFWGCQSSAPFYWTGGAFLRQDWLFFLVMAACLARKKYFKLAGASMVYAGLLRVFPGLAVIGWLTVAGAYLVKHKRMAKHHQQMLIGGVLAAAVLIPASIKICGKDSYQSFYKHTLEVHDRTPLTNHMGLRVLIGHNMAATVIDPVITKLPDPIREFASKNIGFQGSSGRMKYTKDGKLTDPFEVWKRMRNERYDRYKIIAYAIILASLGLFVWIVRRVKSMWVAQCLGQIFIILLSQLTCYYYSFMILMAPLTRVKRQIEAPLFGLAALSQFVWMASYWNDDKYTWLTLFSLLFCFGVLFAFAPREAMEGFFGRFRKSKPDPEAQDDEQTSPASAG